MGAKNPKLLITLIVLSAMLMVGLPQALAAERVGSVTVISGKATVTRAGTTRSETIRIGTPIYQFDQVKTEQGAKVRIVFIDQSIVSIGGGSGLTISEYVFNPQEKVRSSKMNLLWGKVKCYVNDFMGYRSRKFNVATNTTIVGVRGTVFLVWIVDNKITKVASFENEVEVRSQFAPEDFVVLQPNQMTEILAGQAPEQPVLLSEEQLAQLQSGLLNQDQQSTTTTSPETTTEETTTEETTTEATTTEETTTEAVTTESTSTQATTTEATTSEATSTVAPDTTAPSTQATTTSTTSTSTTTTTTTTRPTTTTTSTTSTSTTTTTTTTRPTTTTTTTTTSTTTTLPNLPQWPSLPTTTIPGQLPGFPGMPTRQ